MDKNAAHQELKGQAGRLPTMPGVYLMKDRDGEVIYVGKAKDLKARVRTYFAGGDGRAQIEFLLRKIFSLDHIVTENEQQAFILERDLITKYKPRYNIRLKDDKAYLSVRIDQNQEWPRLELVRQIEQDGAHYFGPYTYGHELKTLLEIINRVVPLRTCTNTVLYNRQRPCLEHQIKRCAGPCCLPVSQEEYAGWVKQAMAILRGKSEGLIKQLEADMEDASEDLRFEDAAIIRDRVGVLKKFASGESLMASRGEDRDVFAIHREEKLVALSVLKMRHGRISGNENFTFTNVEIPDENILESAIGQFYDSGREIPEEILVPQELGEQSLVRETLREKRKGSFEITVPQRGLKFRLLMLAHTNARQHFVTKFDAEARYAQISEELARRFKLKQIPRRIECVDISNFQGSDIVGALVVFFDGEPVKKWYRKYKINSTGKPDDFAAVHEVVARRIKKGAMEDDLPDLLVIDGGAGQLSAALAARNELDVPVEIVALAKFRVFGKGKKSVSKPERVYTENSSFPILLKESSETTKFLQRLRDETHRFVITFHKSTRAKRVFKSALDDILGIGPERKARLMRRYGSVKKIKEATAEDLATVGRMSPLLGQKVLDHLNKRD